MSISQNYPNVAPQLLIDLANTQQLDPRVTFARATTGTYYDENGVLRTAPSGVPRFQFDPVTGVSQGLLRENQATNLVLNSDTLVTQNVTVTAVAHTLSFFGTGQIVLSGVSTATVVGLGAFPSRVTLTFTPTAGTLTLTVTGTVEKAQLEIGSFATSYIKTVASQVTRSADTATLTNTSAYNTAEFTAVTKPFGVASVASNRVTLNGDVPIERLYVYPRNISQNEINALVENDGWWSWRIVGSTFALPNFATDGSIQVDWGDGVVETLTTAVHTFTNASPHTVRFRQLTGTYFRPFLTNNSTYGPLIRAVGSAPTNLQIQCQRAFWGATNLKSFDATFVGTGTDFTFAWQQCTSLTSFPTIDTSSGTNFGSCWSACSSLTSFPLIDTGSGTNFASTWRSCSSLTSFPLIDTSAGISFAETWQACTSLTSFPLIDTSSGTSFFNAWGTCSSLTSFPLIDTSLGTNFSFAWVYCASLTSFPTNMFDAWIGVPVANCFINTWLGCSALTTTSVENILVSINTSGVSAPAGTDAQREITIDYNVATGALTTPTTTAITALKGKNWTIKINGVLQ